jgi:hypothetical protein
MADLDNVYCAWHNSNRCYCRRRVKARHQPLTNFADGIDKFYPYGYSYNTSTHSKYVCFKCRIYGKSCGIVNNINTTNCYRCNKQTAYVGEKFRPPKKNDIKAWKKSEELYNNNSREFEYGDDGHNDDLPNTRTKKNISPNMKFFSFNIEGNRYTPKYVRI